MEAIDRIRAHMAPVKVSHATATRSEETMTSSQLLELIPFKSKSELNRAIRNMFREKIDDAVIASSYDNRGYVTEYHLPELESKMFVAKYDITYLEQITQYWIDRKQPRRQVISTGNPLLDALVATQMQVTALQEKSDSHTYELTQVKDKVEEVLTRNTPPAGYDSMTGLEKFFGISAQKLKILARRDNVHNTRYVVRAPDGSTATVTAYNVEQLEMSVDNLLWSSRRPTEHYLEHSLIGRYSRIKLQSATRADTNASRKALTM